MQSLPKPEIILTHESDLDGFVSGLLLQKLARHLFNEEIKLQAYQQTYWQQRSMREKSAWVSDLGFESRIDKPDWVVLDHHHLERKPGSAWLIHDLDKCSAALCYGLCQENGFQSDKLRRLVELTQVADLYQREHPDFVTANDYANLIKTYQFWNLYALIKGEPEALVDHPLLEVIETKRRVENPLGYEWSQFNVEPISKEVGLVKTTVGDGNLIVHDLLENDAIPYTVLITLFRKSNGVVLVSLRSRNGEALQAAKKLQGGGHPNASGATLPRSVRSLAAAGVYLKQVFNPPATASETVRVNDLESAFDGA